MKGVLLVNLGSPEAPTPEAVKPYLDEFLMDPRVIDLPFVLRWLLVKGIILNTRPKKSAAAYQKIWWKEGSPLVVLSKRVQEALQKKVELPVVLAMRYGKPSIASGLEALTAQGVTDVLVVPLYPQYAMATTQTIEVLTKKLAKTSYPNLQLTFLPAFYHQPEYIKALSQVIAHGLETAPYDHLLFSYHGVPVRHLRKTDPTGAHRNIKIIDQHYCCTPGSAAAHYCYRTHCFETTRAVASYLNLAASTYSQSFQSRLGMDAWLTPFTADQVVALAQKGVKNLVVVTPAFVADCIETLEEIELEAGAEFIKNGGTSFRMISCLNDDAYWVSVLENWINQWEAHGA